MSNDRTVSKLIILCAIEFAILVIVVVTSLYHSNSNAANIFIYFLTIVFIIVLFLQIRKYREPLAEYSAMSFYRDEYEQQLLREATSLYMNNWIRYGDIEYLSAVGTLGDIKNYVIQVTNSLPTDFEYPGFNSRLYIIINIFKSRSRTDKIPFKITIDPDIRDIPVYISDLLYSHLDEIFKENKGTIELKTNKGNIRIVSRIQNYYKQNKKTAKYDLSYMKNGDYTETIITWRNKNMKNKPLFTMLKLFSLLLVSIPLIPKVIVLYEE